MTLPESFCKFSSAMTDTATAAMPLGDVMEWLPVFVTPIWIIAVGLLIGAVVTAIYFGVLAALSLIPGVGSLCDDSRRGNFAALVLAAIIAIALMAMLMPGSDRPGLLVLPLAVIAAVLGYATVYGFWARARREWGYLLSEGVIPYILSTAAVFAVVGLAGTPLTQSRDGLLASIPQVNVLSDGIVSRQVTIPPGGEEQTFVPAGLDYDFASLAEIEISSDKRVFLADAADPSQFGAPPVELNPGVDEAIKYQYEDRDSPPIPADPAALHIYNQEIDPATVTFIFQTLPRVPQATTIVFVAIGFFLLMASLVALRMAAPRVWALALSTAKNEMSQPLYLLLLAIGMFLIVLFMFMPFYTMGDDIRVLKDSAVTCIMLLALIQVVWSAGTAVSEEIDGRTALTVLSKPVSRRSFILGKYTGIMLAVLVLFVILGAVLLGVVSYKPIFDAREGSKALPEWQEGHAEVVTTIPVLGLYLMETMAIGGVAVALAMRLPLLANFVTCFAIYVIGNLTGPLVASSVGESELVGFVAKLIAVVVPNLNAFNVQSAVDAGSTIPVLYLAAAFNYLFFFVVAIWMVAMLLFEDRDLA